MCENQSIVFIFSDYRLNFQIFSFVFMCFSSRHQSIPYFHFSQFSIPDTIQINLLVSIHFHSHFLTFLMLNIFKCFLPDATQINQSSVSFPFSFSFSISIHTQIGHQSINQSIYLYIYIYSFYYYFFLNFQFSSFFAFPFISGGSGGAGAPPVLFP